MKPIFAVFALALPLVSAAPLYYNIPTPLPYNIPSLGYQATSTQEFGGLVQLAGNSSAVLQTASVVMSNWALESTYQPVGTSSGFAVPLTLNLYNVGASNSVGPLIASYTIEASILWRPEASPGCSGGRWLAPDNNCYSGFAQTVAFSLGGINTPSEFIYGLAFNTPNYGYSPIGSPSPTASLNFGLSTTAPTVGTNPLPGTVYWNTSNAANYADGGTGGVNTFRLDTGWAPYSGAVCFDDGQGCPGAAQSVPEPATYALTGVALGLLALSRRR